MKTLWLALLLVVVLVQPVFAFAGQPPAAPAQATPVPQQTASNAGGFPWLGLLVFLVPLVYLAYKSRGQKTPDVRAASCMPVIDESKSPFAPRDEDKP